MFAAFVVEGYEYHDDYIETSRYSVTLEADHIYTMGEAEAAILDAVLGDPNDPSTWSWEDTWARIESIERVS